MINKNTEETKRQTIKQIINDIVITKKEGANKEIMKNLYQLRYGKDWNKYYPAQ